MDEETKKERSRLLNKHKAECNAAEKDIKKKKGAMKEAAQAKYEEILERHAQELAEFDKISGGGEKKEKSGYANDKGADSGVRITADLIRTNKFDGYSKTELAEECELRGISKKGGKEDLTLRLISWIQEMQVKAKEDPSIVKPDNSSDEEDSDDSEEADTDEDDDSDSDTENEVSPEEMEKQGKREKIIQGKIYIILKDDPDGFPLDELPEQLAERGVKNFSPTICGYKTLEKFASRQPEQIMYYSKKKKWIRAKKAKN